MQLGNIIIIRNKNNKSKLTGGGGILVSWCYLKNESNTEKQRKRRNGDIEKKERRVDNKNKR